MREKLLTEQESLQLSCAIIRDTAQYFGHDLSHLTNEQMIANYQSNTKELAKHIGFTADDFAKRMSIISKSLNHSTK